MTDKDQNRIECGQFEALLPDALDGTLPADASEAFYAHTRSCPACGPIFAEARQGMLWLRALEEVQPPANLVHNILAATSAAEAAKEPAKAPSQPGWLARFWKPVRGMLEAAMRPRFATSFSMAFFSLSLTLTLAGVKLKDLGHIDWHPSAVSKAVVMQYTQLESKVVRYYNNMRLVYEIESRVGQMKKAEQKSEQPEQPKPEKKKKDNNDTSGRPEQRQDNYSQQAESNVIAYLENETPRSQNQ